VYDAAWSPDGNKIAFAAIESEDGKHSSRTLLKVIDLAAAQVRAVYADLARPDRIVQPRWSPDGASLVFEQDTMDGFSLHPTKVLSSRIGTVDLKGGKPRFIAFGRTGGPQTPDWGAHGIVFSRGGNLFSISPTGGPVHRLTAFNGTTQQAIQPTFSPDGRRIVFTYLTKGYGSAYRPAAAVIKADGGGFALISGADGLTHPRLKP
jgi:Tol biopolymer transport system component